MGVNNEDDDEEPLVIVADTDPNQPMVYYGREGDNYASRDCLLEKVPQTDYERLSIFKISTEIKHSHDHNTQRFFLIYFG
ncbi:hypothetical protein IGI04_005396 [Brassica rapa subsp. trilocularis]|uniref:Uncharacterized protein n=1 Tax=Brassica rapa subsp. trilocularis TaxID=1813537 RepID=A0ABQ7NDV7_BRACM|nr:hypothetical protein IGI04_005396 [Brassica rapa subsp. trilocularis]